MQVLTCPTRFALAPMTRTSAEADGAPNPLMVVGKKARASEKPGQGRMCITAIRPCVVRIMSKISVPALVSYVCCRYSVATFRLH